MCHMAAKRAQQPNENENENQNVANALWLLGFVLFQGVPVPVA